MANNIKCIYCNTDRNLTESDIIPYVLTGAKLRKKFVCGKHNCFTNDNYEETWSRHLSVFRNRLDFTTRDGEAVPYFCDIEADGILIKNVKMTTYASFFYDKKRLFHSEVNHEKCLIGGVDKLMQVKNFDCTKITELDVANGIKQYISFNYNDCFFSNTVLHAVAKIAYEAHCYYNGESGYNDEKYHEIVNFILSPNLETDIVSIVIEKNTYNLQEQIAGIGDNILFEITECDGYKYVVFGFWGIVIYKIRICRGDTLNRNFNKYIVHLYLADGTQKESIFGIVGPQTIRSAAPTIAFEYIKKYMQEKIFALLNEKSFSFHYLKHKCKIYREKIAQLSTGQFSIEEFLDCGNPNVILLLKVFEIIYHNRENYDSTVSFNENMHNMITKNFIVANKAEIVQFAVQYKSMYDKGELIPLLLDELDYFDTISDNE